MEPNADDFERGLLVVWNRYRWFIGIIFLLIGLIIGLLGYRYIGLTETVEQSEAKAESIKIEADSVLFKAREALAEANDRKKESQAAKDQREADEKLNSRMEALLTKQMDFYTGQSNYIGAEGKQLRQEFRQLDERFAKVDAKLAEVEDIGEAADKVIKDNESKLQQILKTAADSLDSARIRNAHLPAQFQALQEQVHQYATKQASVETIPLSANGESFFSKFKYVVTRDESGNMSVWSNPGKRKDRELVLGPFVPVLGVPNTIPETVLSIFVIDKRSEPWSVGLMLN